MPEWRPTTAADVPGIIELISVVYAEYECVIDLENVDAHLQAPGPYCRESGGDFWVVERDGRIVAVIGVLLHANDAELKSLYVASDARRCGLGRRLCELVIDYARRADKPKIILWSDTRFEDAHRLYESLGFVRGGSRDLHDINRTIEFGYEMPL